MTRLDAEDVIEATIRSMLTQAQGHGGSVLAKKEEGVASRDGVLQSLLKPLTRGSRSTM
ncbi:hypothetical protein [Massilia sp. ST3]|uniref:hypothetical protein n=1 Tax=Massilia sp. ST3 TaxID=2824903 RepID=UPI001B82C7AE|nr:hypothetical protein [Massilia sp. ST3]MBQ5947474.1 hypothetical protein [Massilia sp. ST3]